MRRQTKKHYVQDRGYYLSCSEFCREDGCGECSSLDEAVDRLGAYEDTGLMPEEFDAYWKFLRDLIGDQKASEVLLRFRELAKADRDGRVVILPVRTVYALVWGEGPNCHRLCPSSIDGDGRCDLCIDGELHISIEKCRQEHIDKIGKTVFLTWGEAEKARERGRDDDDGA